MDNLIKLNASVVSRMGVVNETNENNFYLNGRVILNRHINSVQASIEKSGHEYVFAVADGMDRETVDKNSSISVIKELKKFHEKMKNSEKDFEYKFEDLCECVEEANNIVYSILLGEGEDIVKRPAFAGLVISGNRAAALNIGECRVYLLRGGILKQLSSDYKKAERLLKMGIITDEQAEALSDRFDMPADGRRVEVKKSDFFNLRGGDIFLLCNRELVENIEEESLIDILSLDKDTDFISNVLIKEALRSGTQDDLTAMVVRIDSVSGEEKIEAPRRKSLKTQSNLSLSKSIGKPVKHIYKRRKAIKKILSVAAALVVIFGVVFAIVKLWNFLSSNDPTNEVTAPTTEEQGDPWENDSANDSSSELEPIDESGGEGEEELEMEEPATPVTYEVKKGDTLYQISRKFYNDPQKYKLIMEANGIEDPNKIMAGQILVIPPEN